VQIDVTPRAARALLALFDDAPTVDQVVGEMRRQQTTDDNAEDPGLAEELGHALDALDQALAGKTTYARALDATRREAGYPNHEERQAFRMARESSAIRYARQHRQPAPREVNCLDEKGMKIALQVAARRKCSFDEACRLLRR